MLTSVNSTLAAGRLPRSVHEELALILKMVGNKEHNHRALEQLYDLRVTTVSEHSTHVTSG